MNAGKTLFAQLMDFLPWTTFTRCVTRYGGNKVPSFIHISDGKLHDVHALDLLTPEAGAIYVMDRGYVDFTRLHRLHLTGAFFVTRAKSNIKTHRVYSVPTDRSTGIICDQTIALDGFNDPETGNTLVFLTNQMSLPAATICALYKSRWYGGMNI